MSNNYGPKIVTDGLVLCLDAADQNSYSGSGNTWTDLSGNGNNGTLINGPTFTSENYGSIIFDGSNDYINCGTPTSLQFGTGSFSISQWFYVASGNLLKVTASKLQSAGWWLALDNRYNDNTEGIGFSVNSQLYSSSYHARGTTSDFKYNINQWNNVVAVWDGINKNMLIYLNNVLTTTTQTQGGGIAGITNTDSSTNNIIGAYTNGASFNFNGKISQTMIYNKVLTASEVSQNYQATKGRFGL